MFDASVIPPYEISRWVLLMSMVGFGMMAFDKTIAGMGDDRISERTLILLAFAGGFLGIILSGQILHHKTSKPGFMAVAVFAGVVWLAGLTAYALGLLKF